MASLMKFAEEPVQLFAQLGLEGQFAHLQTKVEDEAKLEGLGPLNGKQWAVIQFVLDFHAINDRVPPAVRIGRATGLSPRRLQKLFPAGAAKTSFRLAGLEFPREDLWTLSAPIWN